MDELEDLKAEYAYFDKDPVGREMWKKHIEGMTAAVLDLIKKGLL